MAFTPKKTFLNLEKCPPRTFEKLRLETPNTFEKRDSL
jgi:hypothetical protein